MRGDNTPADTCRVLCPDAQKGVEKFTIALFSKTTRKEFSLLLAKVFRSSGRAFSAAGSSFPLERKTFLACPVACPTPCPTPCPVALPDSLPHYLSIGLSSANHSSLLPLLHRQSLNAAAVHSLALTFHQQSADVTVRSLLHCSYHGMQQHVNESSRRMQLFSM